VASRGPFREDRKVPTDNSKRASARASSGEDPSYRFSWTVPDSIDPELRGMVAEIVRRGRRNEHLGDKRETHRRWWARMYMLLGAPAAVLAGVSGAVILGSPDSNVLAGVIALMAAALGALLGFLDAPGRARRAEIDANRYWLISAWARFVVAAEAPFSDRAGLRALLMELQRREETVMTTAISGAPPDNDPTQQSPSNVAPSPPTP
jgi:hypothetical protein